MTTPELIKRIVDSFFDFADCPSDYLGLDPMTLDEATEYLAEQRKTERECELEPDECLPEEVTPELYMEASNYHMNHMKFLARIERLAEWLTENECVCEHDSYYGDYPNNDPCVVPTDFICNELKDGFYFDDDVTIDDLIEIGANSKRTFSFDHEYCWYDKEKKQLFSSDTPFHDGIIDTEAMARFILLDANAFGYMFDHIIDDKDAEYILGCTKEEFINE